MFAPLYKIVEVTEFLNLHSECKSSYYECLVERFRNFDFSNLSDQFVNSTECTYQSICYPFSLPQLGEHIPICSNEDDGVCYEHDLDNLKEDQRLHCKKSCRVKEFKVKFDMMRQDMMKWKKENWTWNETFNSENSHIIEYRFEQPEWIRDQRSDEPFKTVHREILAMSFMSLVGNVGGTLGMFIGFSFVGTSEWFMDLVGKWHSKVSHKLKK